MHERLVIIGASGHGKVVADVARCMKKYKSLLFLDDNENLKKVLGIVVSGKTRSAIDYIKTSDIFVAIGNADTRKKILVTLEKQGAAIATLIHPKAVIGENVQIGAGTVVMAGTVINCNSKIGKGCIINTCSSVDHDCNLADYIHISVGAHVAGSVKIGGYTWIGAGAVVSNNISIGRNCMIGAGAVVIHDINEEGIYVGVPAKKKNG